MKPFTVIVVRESEPKDQTCGWHGEDFATKKEAMAYAESEFAKGFLSAAVLQTTVTGTRKLKKYARA